MYEEMIKRLRNCASDTVEDCAGCPYQGGYKGTYCMNGLVAEAADAIEELQAQLMYSNDAAKKIAEKVPKWIPVTEDTPSDFVSVQAHMTDAGQFPSVREAYTVDGLWFFPALKEFHPVDAWKRFDEPPKEET